MLHLGSVGKYMSYIWGWSVHCWESGDLQGSSMGLSLLMKTRLPSEPESNRTRTNFCL